MILRVFLLFLPIFLSAQDLTAPPAVDQELRARVNGFYENFLENSFSPRKAEPFVAEDTKDYFYNAGKNKYQSFQLGKITYSDNFARAVVVVIGKMDRLIGGQVVTMDVPQDTHWKIENEKWCWYYDPKDFSLTPIGVGGKNPPPATTEAGAPKIPKNTSPDEMRKAGRAVLEQQPMELAPSQVTMIVDKPASTEVVFTNGADGDIQIALDGPAVRGLTATLDKTTVPGHGKAVLSFHYDPSDKSGPKDVWEPKGSIRFSIVASPFNRYFPVFVQFTAAK
jgi:hypothetical protein